MKVAIFQCAAGGLDPTRRLAKLSAALDDPAGAAADLLVCPELFMSGYNVGDALQRYAEPCNGPFAKAVASLARGRGKAILYGYPERDGTKLFNSAACFGSDGALLANHRKLVLPPGFESQYFDRGDTLTFLSLGGVKFALLVCYDAEFPETVRAVARRGVHAVIAPTALKDNWNSVATRLIPTRAFENGIYMIYANHAGSEGDAHYLGASCIIGPDGEDVARAGSGEEVVAASLDLDAVKRARARLPYLEDVSQLSAVATS